MVTANQGSIKKETMAMMVTNGLAFTKFKKDDLVILPANIIRPGSSRRGKIISNDTVELNGVSYCAVAISRINLSNRLPDANTLWVSIANLRLDVLHSACPDCRCSTVSKDNEDNEDDEEEDEDEHFC
jgi:hypothetical protein